MTRRIATGTRAMNNYRLNSPSPYLREELHRAKAGLEESVEEFNKAFSTLMAADDLSMFAVYDELLEAQLLLAEPHLLDLNEAIFVIDRLLLTPQARSVASRGHSPLC